MQKRLIEWDLPLADISEESAREKNIRSGNLSGLHIWWARRPQSSSRATVFAALLNDPGSEQPEKRNKLNELISAISSWEAVKEGNSEKILEARKLIEEQYGYLPKILDPFSGGGAIPLEAYRLGCETYASDYNPVAVFLGKATLEWPQKYNLDFPDNIQPNKSVFEQLSFNNSTTKLLIKLIEKWSAVILEETIGEVGRYYPNDNDGWVPVGYLWARTIPCENPSCNTEIPLIGQYWLSKKGNKKVGIKLNVTHEHQISFEVVDYSKRIPEIDPSIGTVNRGNVLCPVCGQVTKSKSTRELAKRGLMNEKLIALVLVHPNIKGKKYRIATADDEKTFVEAGIYLDEKLRTWKYLDDPLPNEPLTKNSRYMTPTVYGFSVWKDIFNKRQQLLLVTLQEKIRDNTALIKEDCRRIISFFEHLPADIDGESLATSIVGYLAIIFDRFLRFSTNLCI